LFSILSVERNDNNARSREQPLHPCYKLLEKLDNIPGEGWKSRYEGVDRTIIFKSDGSIGHTVKAIPASRYSLDPEYETMLIPTIGVPPPDDEYNPFYMAEYPFMMQLSGIQLFWKSAGYRCAVILEKEDLDYLEREASPDKVPRSKSWCGFFMAAD
jgi:hypothetical protein